MRHDMSGRQVRVWDLPVRLFHWLLVALVGGAWLSAELGNLDIHQWFGYSILSLLLFRLLWGLAGSDNARFTRFVRPPAAVRDYLAALRGGAAPHFDTHNPAGGWSVLGMLLLLLLQAGSGLFASDDVLFEGPFFPLVGGDGSEWLTDLHKFNFNLVLALVGLHLAAVALHQWRGEGLVQAMWHGRKVSDRAEAGQRPLWLALLLLGLAAAGVWGLLALAPAPDMGF